MTVELRLTGTAVQLLADQGHIPGWPDKIDPELADIDSADYLLDWASARWYLAARSHAVGRGRVYVGPASPRDIQRILRYLDLVAGLLHSASKTARWEADETAAVELRAEARLIRTAIDRAVTHLRRSGTPVRVEMDVRINEYHVGPEEK